MLIPTKIKQENKTRALSLILEWLLDFIKHDLISFSSWETAIAIALLIALFPSKRSIT